MVLIERRERRERDLAAAFSPLKNSNRSRNNWSCVSVLCIKSIVLPICYSVCYKVTLRGMLKLQQNMLMLLRGIPGLRGVYQLLTA